MKRCLACLSILLLSVATVRAAVQVGQPVVVQFKAVDGTNISTEALKGKLVVLDFWATWCGPCMQMVPHMVEMNQKYASKGVVIVGISLDEDRAAMLQTIKQQGMTWPEYFDGAGWGNRIWKQYGSKGIPFTILLGPDGTALWTGHAALLEPEIIKALKEHPPQLVEPATLARAKEMLGDAQEKMQSGDTRGAIKALSRVPVAAKLDETFAAQAADVQKKLEASADATLADVQKMINARQYTEAVPKLKELADAFYGMPSSTKAKKMISDLVSNPDAREALNQAEKSVKAEEALAGADKLRAEKKHELAYTRYKEITKAFAGTEAADKAGAQVKVYEQDQGFVKRVNDKAGATRARAALSMAASYKNAGNTELARQKYQSVIHDFPGTPYAETATRALAELGQ
jgi:thiol-disulfide isomerase/thioredoxin